MDVGGGPRATEGEPRPFTVIMTGRMEPAKDFTSLVAAARLLTAAGDEDWRFVVVGRGSERERLERQAERLVTSGRLSFVDAGLEVLDHVREADVGVLLTNTAVHAEGCSNSLLEYMSCSLPVICTDSGGQSRGGRGWRERDRRAARRSAGGRPGAPPPAGRLRASPPSGRLRASASGASFHRAPHGGRVDRGLRGGDGCGTPRRP